MVRILQAHTVTIDDTSAAAYTVSVDGTLAFNPAVDTALYVTNLQIMAGDMGMGTPGVLEVGTTANPIAADVTADDHHRQQPARRRRSRSEAVRNRNHRVRENVDARQRADADLRAPRD